MVIAIAPTFDIKYEPTLIDAQAIKNEIGSGITRE